MVKFEWDNNKNQINIVKHDISFKDACSIFQDPNILSMLDEKHSTIEERWISLGINKQANILVVVHTERKNNIIRLISARKATPKEQKVYFQDLL